MKNYKALYGNNKSSGQVKNIQGIAFKDNPFQKNCSLRKFQPMKLKRQPTQVDRLISRSIQETPSTTHRQHANKKIKYIDNSIDNEEADDNNEFFKESYKKINKMRAAFTNYQQIESQLQDILNLIKEQRIDINAKLSEIKSKQIKQQVEIGVNTQEIIAQIQQKNMVDECSQTEEMRKGDRQIYQRLGQMLNDMGINCKDILPNQIEIEVLQIKEYKELSENEIIKIQKFFIKKLAQKMNIS